MALTLMVGEHYTYNQLQTYKNGHELAQHAEEVRTEKEVRANVHKRTARQPPAADEGARRRTKT